MHVLWYLKGFPEFPILPTVYTDSASRCLRSGHSPTLELVPHSPSQLLLGEAEALSQSSYRVPSAA